MYEVAITHDYGCVGLRDTIAIPVVHIKVCTMTLYCVVPGTRREEVEKKPAGRIGKLKFSLPRKIFMKQHLQMNDVDPFIRLRRSVHLHY